MKTGLTLCPLVCLCLLTAAFRPPRPGPGLRLTANLVRCTFSEEKNEVRLSLSLRLAFENTGDTPLLLLADGRTLIGREIRGRLAGRASEERLRYVLARAANERGPEWLKRRKALDLPAPPEGIKRLAPGESFTFDEEDWFYVSKNSYAGVEDRTWGELLSAEGATLGLTYEMWPQNIEPTESTLEDRKFGKRLRARWKRSGHLWLEDVNAAPIALRLQACAPAAPND